MPAWQARSHVELADKHAVVSRLGYGRGVHRVGEQLRVGEAAGVGEPGAHGAWHEAGDGDAGSLQLAPERVAPAGDEWAVLKVRFRWRSFDVQIEVTSAPSIRSSVFGFLHAFLTGYRSITRIGDRSVT